MIGADQTCQFESRFWHFNSKDSAYKYFWTCVFSNKKLNVDLFETVSYSNITADSEVTAIIYESGNIVEFWSSAIFTKFSNAENFKVTESLGIDVIKPEYLKSADNLKMFIIENNEIVELQANLFVDAPKLENINLSKNKIAVIHEYTFRGLSHIKGIYLSRNKLKTLRYNIFQHLWSLQVLDLWKNDCLNKRFEIVTYNHRELENAIETLCGQGSTEDMSNLGNKDNVVAIQVSHTKCVHSNECGDGIASKLDKMQKQIDELAKNVDECKLKLFVSKKNSSENYLWLLRTLLKDRSLRQENSREFSKMLRIKKSEVEKAKKKGDEETRSLERTMSDYSKIMEEQSSEL